MTQNFELNRYIIHKILYKIHLTFFKGNHIIRMYNEQTRYYFKRLLNLMKFPIYEGGE